MGWGRIRRRCLVHHHRFIWALYRLGLLHNRRYIFSAQPIALISKQAFCRFHCIVAHDTLTSKGRSSKWQFENGFDLYARAFLLGTNDFSII